MSILLPFSTISLAIIAAILFRAFRSTYPKHTHVPYDFKKSKDYYHWTSTYGGWNERATQLPQDTQIAEPDLVCAAGVQGMGGHFFAGAFFGTGIVVRGDGKILQLAERDAVGFHALSAGVRELPQIHQRDYFAIHHGGASCSSTHRIFLTIPGQKAPMEHVATRGGFEIVEVFDPEDGPAEMRPSDYGVNISVNGFYKHYRRMCNGEDLPQCLWELLGLLEERERVCNSDSTIGDDDQDGPPCDLVHRMRQWRGLEGIVADLFD